jgi:DNA end-binding protein Ku
VSVPVRLYNATSPAASLPLHQIHEPSGKRIRYQKVAPGVGPVDTGEIIKGFEIEKNKYVLLTDEELDELKVQSKKTIELVQFVEQGAISPLYYESPYYLTPDGEIAEEAYAVVRDALRQTNMIGVGQLAMRGKDRMCAIRPCGEGLLLEMLRFAREVRDAEAYFEDIDAKPDKDALELAVELIQRKAGPFEPEQFHDRYTEALRQLINAKRKGKAVEDIEEPEISDTTNVIDLMAALKRSVGRNAPAHNAGKPAAKKPAKKPAKKAAKAPAKKRARKSA